MSQRNGHGTGLVEPCLPSTAKAPPSGPDWLHEIMALRDVAALHPQQP